MYILRVAIGVMIPNGIKRWLTFSEKTNKFCISMAVHGALVTTETDVKFLNISVKANDLVHLIINNLNITSIDIHTGLQALG